MVRHAEVYNPQDILYGRLPRFRLSEHGRRQAEVVAHFVAGRTVDALYSSPMLRARQTARIIAAELDDMQVRQTSLLLEVRTHYQGEPNSILKPGFSFFEPRKDESDETMEDVRDRMLAFLKLAARRHPGGRVVGVSHADPIAIMRLGLQGKALTNRDLHSVVYPERASVNLVVLTPDSAPEITYFDIAKTVRRT